MNSPPRPRLSVIVITRNEAQRLPRCLASVDWADEIIVVDSGSEDDTVALARAGGARVIETADWPGFGPQKSRALAAATGDWVLSLDADEWLSPELAQEIRQVLAAAPLDADGTGAVLGYELPRLSSFCGQWMRHSGWYPDRVLRLFRRGHGRFSEDRVHERVLLEGRQGRLRGTLLHESIPDLSSAIDKMNRYSSGRAEDLRARGRRGGLGRALAHGLWTFLRTYVLRRGFLDGSLGLVLAIHNAETTFYRYLKLELLGRQPVAGVQHSRPTDG